MINDVDEMWERLSRFRIVKLFQITVKDGILHYTYISDGNNTRQFETAILGYNRVMILYEEMLNKYPNDETTIELLGQSAVILLITTFISYLESIFYKLSRVKKVIGINMVLILKI